PLCTRAGSRDRRDPHALWAQCDHARGLARSRDGTHDAVAPGLMTLLADVVSASRGVAGTSARSRKIAILAELLRRLEPDEIAVATGLLSGVPRQGRVGMGHPTLSAVDASHAAEPSLAIADLDGAIAELQAATGPGSAARRRELLRDLFSR